MTKTIWILAIATAVVAGLTFGMAQATQDEVKVSLELELEKNGNDVDVEVKAKGLASDTVFTVRAYTTTNCSKPAGAMAAVVGSQDSGGNGEIDISGSVGFAAVVTDVNSVSIRSPGGPGPLVQCFLNTTP